MKTNTSIKGFSLLDVLIALAVVSFGILALTALQTTLIRSSSDAKARTAASSLAEDKLEEKRNFEVLVSDDGTVPDYASIATEDVAETFTLSGTTFTRTTQVTDYYFTGPGTPATDVEPAPAPQAPDFKHILVTVSWVDPTGANQQVQIQDVLGSTTPKDVGRTLFTSTGNDTPIVPYVPDESADVLPVAIGDDKSVESSSPMPDIADSASEYVSHYTNFQVVTYEDAGGVSPFTNQRDDYLSVNCLCQQAGAAEADEPTVWEGDRYAIGETVTKNSGALPTSNRVKQHWLCDICCKDHHDTTESKVKYDPFRPSLDYTGGDHNHYNYIDGVLTLANGASQEYLEACSFIRVDGLYRLTTDFKLAAAHLIPTAYLETSSGATAFAGYARDFIDEYIERLSDSYPAIVPEAADMSSYNSIEANLPSLVRISNSTPVRQLFYMGLYVNYLTEETRKAIDCVASASDAEDCLKYSNKNIYEVIPFFLINLSQLGNWSSSNPAIIEVSNEPFASPPSRAAFLACDLAGPNVRDTQEADPATDPNPYDWPHSRGRVCAESGASPGSSIVGANIELSNTGLVDTATIDHHDNIEFHDEIEVAYVNTSDPTPGLTISGEIILSNVVATQPSDIIISGSDGISCSKPTDTSYMCVVDPDIGGGLITIANYNSEYISGNNLVTENNKVCPNIGTVNFNSTADEETVYKFIGVIDDLNISFTIKPQNQNC